MLRSSYMPSRAPQPKSGRDSPPTSPSVAECRLTAQNASWSANRPTGWTRKVRPPTGAFWQLNEKLVANNAGLNWRAERIGDQPVGWRDFLDGMGLTTRPHQTWRTSGASPLACSVACSHTPHRTLPTTPGSRDCCVPDEWPRLSATRKLLRWFHLR